MPPVLDPSKSKKDGLVFLGLSLARKSEKGHPDTATHQTAFDLNEVLDREDTYVFSSNDDGWLVGGGEPGPPKSYKLASKDSAHVEIMRIGTYEPNWGGVSQQDIIDALETGTIMIPQIEVVPTAVVANGDIPPELEIRFDMEAAPVKEGDEVPPLPINWQLKFLHNQLFDYFHFPSRFCPGAFHSTILRKAEFRGECSRMSYFEKCEAAVRKWKAIGPQPLVPPANGIQDNIKVVKCSTEKLAIFQKPDVAVTEEDKKDEEDYENGADATYSDQYQSGLWLFTDRNNITHFFPPNFLPPYDTDPVKRQIILAYLSQDWNDTEKKWKKVSIPGFEKEELMVESDPKVSTDKSSECLNKEASACGSADPFSDLLASCGLARLLPWTKIEKAG